MKTFKWTVNVPYDIRDEAMNGVLKAYKSNLAKGVKFDIKFRRKKDRNNLLLFSISIG
jgi:hypothetical protein